MDGDIRLLIAEDEEGILNGIERFLRANARHIGTIYTAANGQQALDVIYRHRPHIMLLDIQMPVKTGIEVMKEATAAGVCPATIVLSGHSEFEYARKALQYHAVDYLLKPCRAADILKIVDAMALQLAGGGTKPNTEETPGCSPPVENAMTYIREHYNEDVTLQLAASHAGVSPAYLSTLFTRETGKGFSDFLNSTRIERACDYFHDTGMRTYEVAYKVGFKDEKYFSNVFKKIKGMSPSAYKKSRRDGGL